MRYLTLREVVALHRSLIAQSGGSEGLRDLGMLESALAQPRATFGGTDLYPGPIGSGTMSPGVDDARRPNGARIRR